MHHFLKKKNIVPFRDVDNGRNHTHIKAGNTWETSVPFPQFFCAPKAALKIQA